MHLKTGGIEMQTYQIQLSNKLIMFGIYNIIISVFAVVITTHLKIKIQTNNEMVKSIKIKN